MRKQPMKKKDLMIITNKIPYFIDISQKSSFFYRIKKKFNKKTLY